MNKTVSKLILKAIENNKSSSVIVYGQRSNGKTYLFNHVMKKLRDNKKDFFPINLNGQKYRDDTESHA